MGRTRAEIQKDIDDAQINYNASQAEKKLRDLSNEMEKTKAEGRRKVAAEKKKQAVNAEEEKKTQAEKAEAAAKKEKEEQAKRARQDEKNARKQPASAKPNPRPQQEIEKMGRFENLPKMPPYISQRLLSAEREYAAASEEYVGLNVSYKRNPMVQKCQPLNRARERKLDAAAAVAKVKATLDMEREEKEEGERAKKVEEEKGKRGKIR